jgi:hypothetical protein
MVFWDMVLSSLVNRYQCFGGTAAFVFWICICPFFDWKTKLQIYDCKKPYPSNNDV